MDALPSMNQEIYLDYKGAATLSEEQQHFQVFCVSFMHI